MNFHIRKIMGGIGGVIIVAILMRLPFLGTESLWNDEVITINDSLASLSTIVTHRWDPHPPLYYLLLHGWLKLGEGDAFVRLPASLFGVLSIWIGFLVAKRLFAKDVAYAYALLMAVAPLHIWYSQETRMYSMLIFWALLSTLFLVMLVQGENRIWIQVCYVLATTLGLYSQYTFLVLLIVQNMMVIAYLMVVKPATFSMQRWFILQLVIILFYVPWLPNIPRHWALIRASTTYPIWIVSTDPFLIGFAVLAIVGWLAVYLYFKQIFGNPSRSISPRLKQLLMVVSLLFSWLIYFAYLAISMTNRLTTLKRQTFILFPFFCLAAIVFISYTPNWKRWAGMLITISFVAALMNNFIQQKPPWREVITLIESRADDNDVMLVSPNWTVTVAEYYLGKDMDLVGMKVNDVGSQGPPLLTEYDQIWLVANKKYELYHDPQRVVVNWFLSQQTPHEQLEYGELEILLFMGNE